MEHNFVGDFLNSSMAGAAANSLNKPLMNDTFHERTARRGKHIPQVLSHLPTFPLKVTTRP